jgi:hypothetical protein
MRANFGSNRKDQGSDLKTIGKDIVKAVKDGDDKIVDLLRSIYKVASQPAQSTAASSGAALTSLAGKIGDSLKSLSEKIGNTIVDDGKNIFHKLQTTLNFNYQAIQSAFSALGAHKFLVQVTNWGEQSAGKSGATSSVYGGVMDALRSIMEGAIQIRLLGVLVSAFAPQTAEVKSLHTDIKDIKDILSPGLNRIIMRLDSIVSSLKYNFDIPRARHYADVPTAQHYESVPTAQEVPTAQHYGDVPIARHIPTAQHYADVPTAEHYADVPTAEHYTERSANEGLQSAIQELISVLKAASQQSMSPGWLKYAAGKESRGASSRGDMESSVYAERQAGDELHYELPDDLKSLGTPNAGEGRRAWDEFSGPRPGVQGRRDMPGDEDTEIEESPGPQGHGFMGGGRGSGAMFRGGSGGGSSGGGGGGIASAVGGLASSGMSAVMSALSVAVGAVSAGLAALAVIVAAVVAAFAVLAAGVYLGLTAVTSLASGFVNVVGDIGKGLVDGLGKIAQGDFYGALASSANTLIDIFDDMTKAVTGCIPLFGGMLQSVVETFTGALRSAINAAAGFAQAMLPLVQQISPATVENFNLQMKNLQATFGLAFGGFVATMAEVIRQLGGVFEPLMMELQPIFTDLAGSLKNFLIPVFKVFVALIGSMISPFRDAMGGLRTALLEAVKSVVLFSGMIARLVGAVDFLDRLRHGIRAPERGGATAVGPASISSFEKIATDIALAAAQASAGAGVSGDARSERDLLMEIADTLDELNNMTIDEVLDAMEVAINEFWVRLQGRWAATQAAVAAWWDGPGGVVFDAIMTRVWVRIRDWLTHRFPQAAVAATGTQIAGASVLGLFGIPALSAWGNAVGF